MVTTVRYPSGTVAKAWIEGVPIEDSVWQQVSNLASVPGVERIAVMPDAHMGNGACVGSAILTRDIIIPAAVGVDIGCGMIAAPLNLTVSDIEEYLPQIRAEIEKRVPVGRTDNGGVNDRGAWGTVPSDVINTFHLSLCDGYDEMVGPYPQLAFPRVTNQLGTLGTGNHFIEVQYEELPDGMPVGSLNSHSPVWIMLHSGSRGIGNRIGTTFTKLAKKEMERWKITLPDPELAFLPLETELGQDYLKYAKWAQEYAYQSRLLMLQAVLNSFGTVLGPNSGVLISQEDVVHVHHNYIAHERHFGKPGLVTRKGAINASLGQLGIIPSSMGGPSFITIGLGNLDSLNTSSHGAGRTMSRTAIKKLVSLEEHLAAIAGIECRQDADVIDETPVAYKNIDAVMSAQAELTTSVTKLKQLIVVKG